MYIIKFILKDYNINNNNNVYNNNNIKSVFFTEENLILLLYLFNDYNLILFGGEREVRSNSNVHI